MSTNANKMDSSEVYSMFESINEKLDNQPEKPTETVQIDLSPVYAMTERFEQVIEEVRKPVKVENHHRHTIDIDIRSNWFFFSWVILVFIIGASFWTIADQRETISEYKENDLKYRYIKMQGQTNEDNLNRIEHQFEYGDSIKIIRKQVEKYEELVKEQGERMERAKQNSEETKRLQDDVKSLKNRK